MSYRPKYGNNLDLPIDAETIQGKSINTTAIDTSDDIPTSNVVKEYVDAAKAYVTDTDNLLNTTGRFVEDVEEDGGLTKTGNSLKHTNEVTAGTVGLTEDTSGSNVVIPYFTYDDNGHLVSKGTRTHTVPSSSAHTISVDLTNRTTSSTFYDLVRNGHSFSYSNNTDESYSAIAYARTYEDGGENYYDAKVYIIDNGTLTALTGTVTLTYRD